jgi:hypothetical protein
LFFLSFNVSAYPVEGVLTDFLGICTVKDVQCAFSQTDTNKQYKFAPEMVKKG